MVAAVVGIVVTAGTVTGCARPTDGTRDPADPGARRVLARQQPFVARAFHPFSGDRWIGNAIAYLKEKLGG